MSDRIDQRRGPLRVYVAGPIGPADEGRRGRVEVAARAGYELLQHGFAPFVPHLWAWTIQCSMADALPYDDWSALDALAYEAWIDYGLTWVATCHAVLRLPGHSPGADREVQHARDLGILVFGSVEEVIRYSRLDRIRCFKRR